MHSPFPLDRSSIVRPKKTLKHYIGQQFPSADYVLMCCFGPEQQGQQTHKELRQALIQSGFRGALVRHLIHVSPLLHRAGKRGYRIRKFAD